MASRLFITSYLLSTHPQILNIIQLQMNKSIYNFRIAAAFFPLLAALVSPSIVHADGANEPIPSFYQEAGLSPNRGYENQHANEHIDPFTGKLQWHYVDLHIPGNGGLDIDIQRSYSSVNEDMGESSPIGVGWTMHFGRVMRRAPYSFCDTNAKPSANPVLELGDGNRQVLYTAIGKSEFITTGMWRGVCRQGGGMDVYSPDGIKYEMSTFGPGVGDITNAQAVC